MINTGPLTIYEFSVCWLATLHAHSLSNSGSISNRLLPRQQLLADGTETDALSGNISKHQHAALLAEYLEAAEISLCPACLKRDARRVGALAGKSEYAPLTIEKILTGCAMCDAHGFLVTAKNSASDKLDDTRQGLSKSALIEFSFGLALPNVQATSEQLFTRSGGSKENGQMLMKLSARSATYSQTVRYKCVGIGVNTDGDWELILKDPAERLKRHQAILSTLRDQILSPMGSHTATLLPHLTALSGAIVARIVVGRAPIYSGLDSNFIQHLSAMADAANQVYTFYSVEEFKLHIDNLIANSIPSLPAPRQKTSFSQTVAQSKHLSKKTLSKLRQKR